MKRTCSLPWTEEVGVLGRWLNCVPQKNRVSDGEMEVSSLVLAELFLGDMQVETPARWWEHRSGEDGVGTGVGLGLTRCCLRSRR